MISKIAAVSAAIASASAAGTDEWKSRSVYQLLTDRYAKAGSGNEGPCMNLSGYCGGTWKGVEDHLDYIQGMGFDAIWISPVVDNIDGGYHGYWARNWEKVNENFGSEDDLKSLVDAAHAKGMYVMVDVVANHAGPIGDDFSQIYPLNRAEHYHSDCDIVDWGNQNQVENCRLAALPDLNQQDQYVGDYLRSWISGLVKKYSFDGIRIDTIPEVPKDFWRSYADAAGVFQMGECFNGYSDYVGGYQGYVDGLFNYPMYYSIKDTFGSQKSMKTLKNRWQEEEGTFKDIDALGIFVDNHDNARFMNQFHDETRLKSALAYSLTARGIPFFYYGSEQAYAGGNDPQNRESLWQDMDTNSDIYQMTAKINSARKHHEIWSHSMDEKYITDSFYAYARGDFLVALTNGHDDQNVSIPNAPFADGTEVCNIFYPDTDCQTIQGGNINVYLKDGEVKVYIPKSSSYFQDEKLFLQS